MYSYVQLCTVMYSYGLEKKYRKSCTLDWQKCCGRISQQFGETKKKGNFGSWSQHQVHSWCVCTYWYMHVCVCACFPAKKITKDIAEVDWANMTVKSIIRLQQALCDRYAVKTSFDSIPVRLHGIGDLLDVVTDVDDFIPSSVESGTPGVAFHRSDSNFVCIRCQDGWVTVEEFHFLGEKEHVLAEDFALEQMQDLKEHISDSLGNTTTSNSNTTSNTSNTTSNSNSDNADEDDEDVYYYIGRFSPS
eukprot:scpid98740/ scgid3473/ 